MTSPAPLPPATELREQLLNVLKTKGLRRLDKPVQLASGAMSQDFIDGKEALQSGPDLLLAAQAMTATIAEVDIEFDAAGGMTMGADAMSAAIAVVNGCRWFVVRKEPKNRGTRKLIEGASLGAGDRVLMVEDVVTTGGSTFKALDVVAETGAQVVAAVALVDRGDTATPGFVERNIPYFPMATYITLGIAPVISP